jgi:DNA-binding PadR family transcriptional regulator
MAKRRKVGNLLALAILAVLIPGPPMHPYEMATVLRRTGKERDMKIKWGSLYTVVQNLEKHGFIQATGSDRDGRRPERTSYTITAAGRAELEDWLRELVGVPEPEQSSFLAALSVLGVLSPDEVIALLGQRLRLLDDDIAAEQAMLAEAGKQVHRIFLIESEYGLAMRKAEADWVRTLLAELTDGTLPGLTEWRDYHAGGGMPEEWAESWAEMLAEGGPPTA